MKNLHISNRFLNFTLNLKTKQHGEIKVRILL